MLTPRRHSVLSLLFLLPLAADLRGQESADPPASPVRGSIVEDRAAQKLIEAGDARYEAEEVSKALEIWRSVIERYPRSKRRFIAHLRLGEYYLERDRSYDRARTHFEAVAAEDNRDEAQRAEATLKTGVCFYHARNYGKCFQIMRDVIERFPVSGQVNQAYYYIGLGHYQLGHYSRAIAALERVGTTLAEDQSTSNKLEAGKRFFIKIEDADLAILDPGDAVKVICESTSGDKELVECFPVGRNVRVVIGSVPTRLGLPKLNDGLLDVKGGDKIEVKYTDQHTADRQVNQEVIQRAEVVGDGHVLITDGAFRESLNGVVLGKTVNIRISDPDRDVSDKADKISAVVEVYRRKTDDELEAEAAERAAQADATAPAKPAADPGETELELDDVEEVEIDPFRLVDRVQITLDEVKLQEFLTTTADDDEAAPPAADAAAKPDEEKTDEKKATEEKAEDAPAGSADDPAADDEKKETEADEAAKDEPAEPEPVDNSIHSGVFQAVVALHKSETAVETDKQLQALPGDQVRIIYLDERHTGEGVNEVQARARCLEGNIGGVRVTRAQISDEELRIQTQLKTADALTKIGNRYKEFGLKEKAVEKYRLGLRVCEDIMPEVRRLKGRLLEETYVQLWHIYFEMDQLSLAAAMAQRLQNEFPTSGFVDDALLQLGDVARKQGDMNRAIGIYNRLVGMKTSQLRGEAQFGIAECFEQMADEAEGARSAQMRDRAFQEYKKVFDQFPESGRVGEAVAKMADHYYQQQDYSRAVDTFETVLENHPDAKFLDVILFNYGRCLYRMDRKRQARQRFEQLIGDFPESPLAPDAKKITEALAQAGF